MPQRPAPATVVRDYFRLGVEHIWRGVDHLLFVAGLLLLAGSARRVAVVVTGFTLAHSVTLSLAALGVIAPPIAATEALIALSILFVARELLVARPESLARRWPVLIATAFGLLHGLGFATALGDIGLPEGQRLVALASFNGGVEAGQLAFVGVLAAGALLLRGPAVRLERATAWAIGIAAGYWFIERGLQAFAA